ncbi:MAG: hypothetical protein GTN76_13285, partial [Candidatus Aenigmarchaeota archaeon]|nr:hypothetical protein [Candidatus Aenigmarchaeota archaeon]
GQLSRLVRKARKKANREAGKLNDTLRLEYREGEGFVDAEYHEPGEEGKEESPGEGEY